MNFRRSSLEEALQTHCQSHYITISCKIPPWEQSGKKKEKKKKAKKKKKKTKKKTARPPKKKKKEKRNKRKQRKKEKQKNNQAREKKKKKKKTRGGSSREGTGGAGQRWPAGADHHPLLQRQQRHPLLQCNGEMWPPAPLVVLHHGPRHAARQGQRW